MIELHDQGIYEIRHVARVGIVAARGNDISEYPDGLIQHRHGVVSLEDTHQRDGQRCAALPVAILITGRHSRDSAPQCPDRLRQCLRVCVPLVAGDQAGPQRVLELAIEVIARVRGRKYGPDLLDSLFQTRQATTSVVPGPQGQPQAVPVVLEYQPVGRADGFAEEADRFVLQ